MPKLNFELGYNVGYSQKNISFEDETIFTNLHLQAIVIESCFIRVFKR